MKVSLWAEIRRLHEIERLSGRAIARRLHCCPKTVAKALAMSSPPTGYPLAGAAEPRESILDRYLPRIDALVAKYPDLSAVRVAEEIAREGRGWLSRQRLPGAALLAAGPADAGTRLPGSALRAGRGHAGRLGRLRKGDHRPNAAAGLGLRGGALLQPAVLYRVQSLPAEGGVLPGGGPCPGVLPGQPEEDHLRQPQGGGHQRFGPQRLLAPGVPGLVRLLLPGTHRLHGAGSGIERDRGGQRAVRQAQRLGGAGRRTVDLGGLPAFRPAMARRGGQRPAARDHQGTPHRPLPEGTRPAPSLAGRSLRHRRDRLRRRHAPCPRAVRRQPLLRAASAGPQDGDAPRAPARCGFSIRARRWLATTAATRSASC